MFDVVIIGGGASGLFLGNLLKNLKVAIVEKNALGKKILVTGNGRCNFTNENLDVGHYNTPLVKDVFQNFNQKDIREFFSKKGIASFSDEEGRVYPLSETAKDIRDVLASNLHNTEVFYDEVIKVTHFNKNEEYEVFLKEKGALKTKNVVVACGNQGLEEMFSEFNLSLEGRKNVLTGFQVQGFDKNLAGVRENAVVRAEGFEEFGQVQFRKDGISGIVIFNLSAKIQRQKFKPFEVHLELIPSISKKQLEKLLIEKKNGTLKKSQCLIGLVKPEMAKFILKKSGVKDLEQSIRNLTGEEISEIIENVKDLSFLCVKTYDDPQVVAGGLDLKNLKDLEYRKGLYFIGEACNVFGVCGGYNLSWAFSSAKFVADKINKKLEN